MSEGRLLALLTLLDAWRSAALTYTGEQQVFLLLFLFSYVNWVQRDKNKGEQREQLEANNDYYSLLKHFFLCYFCSNTYRQGEFVVVCWVFIDELVSE